MTSSEKYTGFEIAVIGLAGRFPGAKDVSQMWDNLVHGRETIKHFTEEEFRRHGADERLLSNENFIKSVAYLDDIDQFDAAFFNYNQREAKALDPQVRIFHQCIWTALEDAGCAHENPQDTIGLYAGLNQNPYWKVKSLVDKHAGDRENSTDDFTINTDLFATLIAHRLNLKGPAVAIHTACSTSLVAVHMASRSLLTGECNVAVAGGISVTSYRQYGYVYETDLIYSPDGHCRAFDKSARGTVPGEGVGVVVLKKLDKAIKDKDHIYAVIKGSAINNDGKRKVGYAAPSVEGQAECILKALRFSKVDPSTISYVEAHGTGTAIGDAIEIAALNEVFQTTDPTRRIPLGSIKTNMGHLNEAAGISGFIKTVLALKNHQIPPTLHFKESNLNIPLDKGPFFVNNILRHWENSNGPLRAGISSFGVGGTNAHVILEEAPRPVYIESDRVFNVLTISAKSEKALLEYQKIIEMFLKENPGKLSQLAYHLNCKRKHFQFRSATVVTEKELREIVEVDGSLSFKAYRADGERKDVVFMFPGQGIHYSGMASDLYKNEPLFRELIDAGLKHLNQSLINDYQIFFTNPAVKDFQSTKDLQPLLFLIEYALARLIMSLGIVPDFMIGHSLGEYVAACVSNVFSLEDALKIVIARGKLMSHLPKGAMLSILQSEDEVRKYVRQDLDLAAVNSAQQCVISGSMVAIDELAMRLQQDNIPCRKLNGEIAFHSFMVESMLSEYEHVLRGVEFQAPSISYLSNVTGKKIRPDEATSVDYWLRHTRHCVKFEQGINSLLSENKCVFIEIGPSQILKTFVDQHPKKKERHHTLRMMSRLGETTCDALKFCEGLQYLWLQGFEPRWDLFYIPIEHHTTSLPTYPFEKTSYPALVDIVKDLFGRMGIDMKETVSNILPGKIAESGEVLIERPRVSTSLIAPSNATEELLVMLFGKVLGIYEVGAEDDFFELGGDSLKAMMVLQNIKKVSGIEISVRDFFKFSNVKKLAAELQSFEMLRTDENLDNEIVI